MALLNFGLDKIKNLQMTNKMLLILFFVFDRVENIVGIGENVASFFRVVKSQNCVLKSTGKKLCNKINFDLCKHCQIKEK